MKRVVISILLATVFASISAFAESRGAHPKSFGAGVISANPAAASPQYRLRRYRIRRYRIRRYRVRRYRVRRYRVRHYHRIYVRRGRRRY